MKRALIAAACALSLTAEGCRVDPVTGRLQLALIGEGREIEMGRQAAREVEASLGLLDAPELQSYVARVGDDLAARTERPELPWSFAVIDDAAVNAFALPGGPVYVTRGLMAYMNNEAQLASVLGHEIGHITARHSIQRISQAQLAALGLGIGAILSEEVRQVVPLAAAGLTLLFLSFSRRDEHEADQLGMRYALRGGYDIAEMADVFRTLERASLRDNGGRVPEWLSTHPSPDDRVERIMERVEQVAELRPELQVGTERYLRQVDGLPYGADPRQGFVSNGRYYHPRLRITMAFPDEWSFVNLHRAVQVVSPEQDALVQVSLDPAETPEAALRRFAARRAVEAITLEPDRVEAPSATALFAARTPQTVLAGLVTFVRIQDRTFQILSVSPQRRTPAYLPDFRRTHASFRQVTDPRLLRVEPRRLEIIRAPGPIRLDRLYRDRGSAVSLEELAILNQMEPDTLLAAEQLIKWVPGERPAAEKR